MRTTLNIDDDVLQAVKEIARSRGSTIGQVISDLVRKAMEPAQISQVRNGDPLLPRRPSGGPMPTMTLVNKLRDES